MNVELPPLTYNEQRAMRHFTSSPYPVWVSLSNGERYQGYNLRNPNTGERASFARPWDPDPNSRVTPLNDTGFSRIAYNPDIGRYQVIDRQPGTWTGIRGASGGMIDMQTQYTSGYYDPSRRPATVRSFRIPPNTQYIALDYPGLDNPEKNRFWQPVTSVYTGQFSANSRRFLQDTQTGFTSRVSFMHGAIDHRVYTYLPATRLNEEAPAGRFTLGFYDTRVTPYRRTGQIIY